METLNNIKVRGIQTFAGKILQNFGSNDFTLDQLAILAANGEHTALLAALVAAGDTFAVNQTEKNGRTLLHHIYTAYHITAESSTRAPDLRSERTKRSPTSHDVVTHLLHRGADINMRDDWGCTPLLTGLQSAIFHGRSLSLIELLIDNGADVNLCSAEGESAVMKCANCDNWVCGRKKGREMTEMEMRAHKCHVNALRLLTANDADVNRLDSHLLSGLMMVASVRDPVLTNASADVLLAVPNVDVNLTNSRNQTALHIALSKNNYDLGNQILSNPDIDVNRQDDDGYTPLYMAVWRTNLYKGVTMETFSPDKDCVSFVEELLLRGADPNIRDESGKSPLDQAMTNSEHIVKVLVNHGADLNPRADQINAARRPLLTVSPLENYVIRENDEMVLLLCHAGASPNGMTFKKALGTNCSVSLRNRFTDRLSNIKRCLGVLTLQHLCRIAIRTSIAAPSLHTKIDTLSIPSKLKTFLQRIDH